MLATPKGGGLTVTTSPPSSSGGGTGGTGHCSAMSAVVAGASGAVTYAWTQISGDPVSILSPTSQTTAFDFVGVNPSERLTATVRVTATNGANTAFHDSDVHYVDRSTV